MISGPLTHRRVPQWCRDNPGSVRRRELGCNLGQGYVVGRATPLDELIDQFEHVPSSASAPLVGARR